VKRRLRDRVADLERRLDEKDAVKYTSTLPPRREPMIAARVVWSRPFDGEASARLELCVDGWPFMVSPPMLASALWDDDRYRNGGLSYPGGQEAYLVAKLAPTLWASSGDGEAS
jgi:hypothetical protein